MYYLLALAVFILCKQYPAALWVLIPVFIYSYFSRRQSKNHLEDGRKTFMPSPMTLNILSSDNQEEEAKNYLVNLFCMQYPHPFDWTPESIEALLKERDNLIKERNDLLGTKTRKKIQ